MDKKLLITLVCEESFQLCRICACISVCVYLPPLHVYAFSHLYIKSCGQTMPSKCFSGDEFMSVERTFTHVYCFAKQTHRLLLYEHLMDRGTFIKSIDLAVVAEALTLTLLPVHCL